MARLTIRVEATLAWFRQATIKGWKVRILPLEDGGAIVGYEAEKVTFVALFEDICIIPRTYLANWILRQQKMAEDYVQWKLQEFSSGVKPSTPFPQPLLEGPARPAVSSQQVSIRTKHARHGRIITIADLATKRRRSNLINDLFNKGWGL